MNKFLQELARLNNSGPVIGQFIDRVTRTTGLYTDGHLPRDAWRHLMIQYLSMNVTEFSAEEKIAKIEINSLIHRMMQFDEQSSN